MKTVPKSRKPVGGSVRTQSDGGDANVLIEEKRDGRVLGLREGDGSRVAGRTSDGTEWEGQGRNLELD